VKSSITEVLPPKAATEIELSMVSVLERLAQTLADENELLQSGVTADHSSFIVSKNQVLKELMALQRNMKDNTLTPDTIKQLKAMRELVDRNQQLLKHQVSALNDVTSFLTQATISEQTDGTYGRVSQ
jgi:hypothetical protein